jgi:ribonuclease HI
MRSLFDDEPDDQPESEPAAVAAPNIKPVTAFTDGGARGNPGPSGYGVHIVSPAGETLAELSRFLGIQTNNVAEYSALLAALEWAVTNKVRHLRVVSDSELMVRQMQGRYKVSSPTLKPLFDQARRLVRHLEVFRIEHVLRGKNKRADALANAAMDSYPTPRATRSTDY